MLNKKKIISSNQVEFNLGPGFDKKTPRDASPEKNDSFSIDKSFRQKFWNYSLQNKQDTAIFSVAKKAGIFVDEGFIDDFISKFKLSPQRTGKLTGNYKKYIKDDKYSSKLKLSLAMLKYYSRDEHLGTERISKYFKYSSKYSY